MNRDPGILRTVLRVVLKDDPDSRRKPPEVDEINFAPRLRIPVLMLKGRYDFDTPMESSQAPMFRLLGTADRDRRYVLFDRGHRRPPQQYVKETLDWFDRYLGIANTQTASN